MFKFLFKMLDSFFRPFFVMEHGMDYRSVGPSWDSLRQIDRLIEMFLVYAGLVHVLKIGWGPCHSWTYKMWPELGMWEFGHKHLF